MSNFTKRLIFGVIYVILIVISTTTNNYIFYSLFAIFMLFSIYEFQRMIDLKSKASYLFGISMFLSTILKFTHNYSLQIAGNILFIISILIIFTSFISTLLDSKRNGVTYLGKFTLTILYAIFPFILIIKIPEINAVYNTKMILGVFILIWTSDTFAYLIGRKFGKTKLFERISPKKTIEGFIGGIFFTFIAAYIVSLYFTNTSLLQWIIISIIISIFGVIGDLVESMFKRQANIKDSSNLIPGHGGFLDRLDSIIFSAPFIYAFIYLTKNFNLLLNVS